MAPWPRVAATLAIVVALARALTPGECAARGFAAGDLACGACAHVRKALGEESAAFADCAACCSTTLDWRAPRRYDTAVLQLGRASASQFHGANEFLEKGGEAEFAPELSVWDVRGERGTQAKRQANGAFATCGRLHRTPHQLA